jgi:hypothetical protein
MEGKENWRDIPGYEELYQVSDRGRARRLGRYGMVYNYLKATTRSGYQHVALRANGKAKIWSLHRLVMLAFVGVCPEGMEVNHKDGNRANNYLGNLEYCTHLQNMQHATNVLRKQIPGNYSGGAKLTAEIVREIRRLVANGEVSQRQLAMLHEVEESTISRIINRETWSDVR